MTIVNVNPLLDEELFQHIWQFRLFTQSGLTTQEGEPLQVDYPGQLNRNAGPDFSRAHIRIGGTRWVGNVELHLKTSDWFRHGHHHNLQYRNVILHVVFEHDMKDVRTNGVPILELQHCIPKLLLQRYEGLRHSVAFVPCAGSVAEVSPLIWTAWKDRLQVERMEQKVELLKNWLTQTCNDWEEVFYRAVARGLGGPVNGENFLRLAQLLPFKLIRRHQHSQHALEALLFGQAGMLEVGDEYVLKAEGESKQCLSGGHDQFSAAESKSGIVFRNYFQLLRQEYQYLRHKYRLAPLDEQSWKWLRMRPASFPGVKIAYMAALFHNRGHLFSRMLEAPDIKAFMTLLKVKPSAYWQEHYAFGKKMSRNPKPGKGTAHNLLINTVFPLLYLYGREKGESLYQEKALDLMSQLPPEDNHVISRWNELGINAVSAADTQALLQLKQAYCDGKYCLRCAVGTKLLRKSIL